MNPRLVEMGLISAVMLDSDALRVPEVAGLRAEHFRHFRGLWEIMLDLRARGEGVNLFSVAQQTRDPRWPADLTAVDLSGFDAYTVRPHELPGAALVLATAYKRDAAVLAQQDLGKALSNPDADHAGAIVAAHARLGALLGETPRDGTQSIADDLDAALARMLDPQAHRGLVTGVQGLDSILGGFQPRTLNIVAGRPSNGKSLFVSQVAQTAALMGERVLMFSLEDGPTVTRMRALARLSGAAISHDLPPGPHLTQQLRRAAERLESLRERWLIDEEARLEGIVSACWRQHSRAPLSLVIVDQLSHVMADAPRGRADNRTQLYGHITKSLKREVAQALNVPVLLVSQLSRDSARRGDPHPELVDLRDSGELEQDADTVTMIHRPELFDPSQKPGQAELLVRKNRNGPLGTITVNCNLKTFRFWEEGRDAAD